MQTIGSQMANNYLSPLDTSTAERLTHTQRGNDSLQQALKVREAFTSFVGETFFHQMIKAVRTSLGKPAYFYGGQAEEIFRGQLDQTLTKKMTAASATQFSEPMFERQFPRLAKLIDEHKNKTTNNNPLNDLVALDRS